MPRRMSIAEAGCRSASSCASRSVRTMSQVGLFGTGVGGWVGWGGGGRGVTLRDWLRANGEEGGDRGGLMECGLTCGSARVTWLSAILENMSHDHVSGCGIYCPVIAAVSAARSDGATNYKRCAAKLS